MTATLRFFADVEEWVWADTAIRYNDRLTEAEKQEILGMIDLQQTSDRQCGLHVRTREDVA